MPVEALPYILTGIPRLIHHHRRQLLLLISHSPASASSPSPSRDLFEYCSNTIRMGSRALIVFRVTSPVLPSLTRGSFLLRSPCNRGVNQRRYTVRSSLEPPDVARLAETSRISLTQQVEQFGPKIQQVVDRFGQLQAVDLDSVEPAIRAGTEGENLREDVVEAFANREGIVAAIPSYEEPYIKVPKILNKERASSVYED